MYSITKDGKVLDYKHKKTKDRWYAFYVGDIYVGQVVRMSRRSRFTWTAISAVPNTHICPIDGFATRGDADEVLLSIMGLNQNIGLNSDPCVWTYVNGTICTYTRPCNIFEPIINENNTVSIPNFCGYCGKPVRVRYEDESS